MKLPIKQIIEAVFVVVIVLFLIFFLWNGFSVGNKTGVLSVVGAFNIKDKTNDFIIDTGNRLTNILETKEPEILYKSRVLKVGETIDLKSLLGIKLPGDETYRAGELEEGFYIQILDIVDLDGNTYLTYADKKFDYSDEINTALIYEEESAEICVYQSGQYRVFFRVVGTNGRTVRKEITIPVEAS